MKRVLLLVAILAACIWFLVLGKTRSQSTAAVAPTSVSTVAQGLDNSTPPDALAEADSAVTSQAAVEYSKWAFEKPRQPDFRKIEAFQGWLEQWRKADAPARATIAPQGLKLASERRPEFKALIVTDPKAALENAVSRVMRQELPAEIVKELEQAVSAVGEYNVYMGRPAAGLPMPEGGLTLRYFEANGNTYQAHVFGDLTPVMSRKKLPLQGVSVDGQFAVSENAVRPLEVGEAIPAGTIVQNTCPVSGLTTQAVSEGQTVTTETPTVDIGGTLITLCNGSHVHVLEDQFRTFIQAAGPGGGGYFVDNFPGTASKSIGNFRCLYIRVCYPDQLGAPNTEDSAYADMANSARYWLESSYGKMIETCNVTPLVLLPHTKAWYYAKDSGSGGPVDCLGLIHGEARNEARKLGYDSNQFDCTIVRVGGGPRLDGVSWGGGNSVWVSWDGMDVLNHECGHSLGRNHANYWSTTDGTAYGTGSNQEYGNDFDVMGGAYGFSAHYNTISKRQLGWLPSGYVHAPTQNGIYRIYAYDQPQLEEGKRYALTVPKDNIRQYNIEYHNARGGLLSDSALVLYSGMGSNAGHLLDTTPGSSGGKADGGIAVGRTYSDWESDQHFTVVAKNATTPPSLDVAYNRGPFPGNLPPTIASLNASATTISIGGSVTFTATASDPNSDTLAYNWQFSDGVIGTSNSSVFTRTFTAVDQVTAMCTVSDLKGGTARASLVINIGAHGKKTISGTVTAGGSPLAGAYVSGGGEFCYTNADGTYTLGGVATGSQTLSASYAGYTFTPTFTNPINVTADVSGADWTAVGTGAFVTLTKTADANEGGANGSFRLTRTGDTTAALTVLVSAVGGTATKTTDYTFSPDYVASGSYYSFTIPAGSATLDITVAAVNDTVAEGPETITMQLASAAGYWSAGSNAVVMTINDNDTTLPQVAVFATDPYATESPADPGVFTFTRTGSTASALDLPVSWLGAAKNGADYTGLPTTVTIPAGQSSTTLTVNPIDDNVIEPPRDIVASINSKPNNWVRLVRSGSVFTGYRSTDGVTWTQVGSPVTVSMTNPCSVGLAVNAHNNSLLVTATFDNVSVTPGVSALTGADIGSVGFAGSTYFYNGTYTIQGSGQDIWTTADAFQFASAPLTGDCDIRARVTSSTDPGAKVGVMIRETSAAGSKNVLMCIGGNFDFQYRTATNGSSSFVDGGVINSSAAYIVDASAKTATVTLTDDDTPYVSVSVPDSVATEAGQKAGVFLISRTGSTAAPLKVYYGLSGTALHGTDYQALPGEIIIPAGATSAPVVITPIDDDLGEPAETVTLSVTTFNDAYSLGAVYSGTVTIMDNADVPLVSVRPGATGVEGGANATVVFRSIGSGTGNTTVNYTVSGTATSGVDYTALSGTVTLPASGTNDVTVTIPITNDAIAEPTETVVVKITPSPNYRVYNDGTATAMIRDNDSGDRVMISNWNDAPSESGAVGRFYVSRTNTAADLTVNYTISGTATNGVDYNSLPGSVLIPAGQSGADITVTPINDTDVEGAETVTLTVVGGTGYGADYPASATLYIADNDSAPVTVGFAISSQSTTEQPGANGEYRDITVNLSAASTNTVTVDYYSGGGTATGDDVDWSFADANNGNAVIPGGTLTFSPGTTSQTIRVRIKNDGTPEGSETAIIQLANPTFAALGTSQHTITITDGNTLPYTVRFATSATTRAEPDGTEPMLMAVLDHACGSTPITVDYTVGGTATPGVRYNLIPGTLTFNPGEQGKALPLTLINDGVSEPPETIAVTLANPTGAQLGTPTTHTITLMDNLYVSGVWGNAAGGSWLDSTNWNGWGIANGSGNTADFSTLNLTADATVTIDDTRTIGNLVFGDTTPSNNWTLNSGSGGPLTLDVASGSPAITVNNQTATISLALAGTKGMTKLGAGTLTLTGANTYTGSTVVNNGVLQIGNGTNAGSLNSASPVSVGANATIQWFRGDTSQLTIANQLTGSGTVAFAGAGTTDVASQYTLSADNSAFSGTVAANGGRIAVSASSQIGTGPVNILANGQLLMSGAVQLANNITISDSSGWRDSGFRLGAIRLEGNSGMSGNLILNETTGVISGDNSGLNAVLSGYSSGGHTLSGVISGTGEFSMSRFTAANSGPVNIDLTGSASNSFTGKTVVDGQGGVASLRLMRTGGAVSILGGNVVQLGSNTGGQANLRMGDTTAIGAARSQWDNQLGTSNGGVLLSFVNASGQWMRFDLQGTQQSVAGLNAGNPTTLAGAVIQNQNLQAFDPGQNATLTLIGSGTYLYNGYLRDQDNGGATRKLLLVQSGTGTQTLVGAQILYSGATTVNAGTLVFSKTSALNTSITNNATVQIDSVSGDDWVLNNNILSGAGTWIKTGAGRATFSNSTITASGSFQIQGGTLRNNNNAANWSGSTVDMDISSGAILDLFADPIYVDQLTGSGFVQNGFGNSSGYSGSSAYIEKLVVGAANGSSTFDGVIRNNSTGTAPASGTAGGGIQLEKNGTGTFTMTGANSYTGVTKVNAGTLLVNGSIANGAVTVANTATLGGTGTLNGAVTVQAGGTIASGAGGIGTLTINNTLSLSGTTTMEVSNAGGTLSSDRFSGISTVTYGGTLAVTNAGPNALVPGNSFTLFSATTRAGSFSSINLPTLNSGFVWDTSQLSVNGTISVRGLPIAVNDSTSTLEDSAVTIAVLANDGDPDGDTIAIQSVTQGVHGSVAIAGSNVTYTPAANWNGTDAFTYTITDNRDGTSTATVSVTVTPVNDPPTFTSNPITGAGATEDVAYSGTLAGSATDVDAGDTLTYSKVSGPAWLSVASNGALSGTPGNSDVGANSFTVKVTDAAGANATTTLNITVANVNDAPTFTANPINKPNATQDSAYSDTIAGSSTDIDAGDTLTYSKVSGPAWLSVASSGALSGTPSVADVGANSFTVRVTDAGGLYADATLQITVLATTNDGTWSNASGGSWPTTGNWSSGIIAVGTDKTANFSTLDLTANATVTLDGAQTIGSLLFGDIAPSHNWTLNAGAGGALTLDVTSGSPAITINNQTTTIGLVLAGTKGLTKAGAGTLVLMGNNTYTGATAINGGTLDFKTPNYNTYSGGQININNGSTMKLEDGGGAHRYDFATQTYNFDASGGGTISTVGTNMNWVAMGNWTFKTNGGAKNTIDGASWMNMNASGHSVVLDVTRGSDSASDLDIAIVIGNTDGSVTKTGNGIATLTAANTYTGGTMVNVGTLRVNGSIGAGAVTVANTGVLGGTGTIGGAVTVESGGTLAPGAGAVGTLTINNTLSLAGTAAMEISKAGAALAADKVSGVSTVTYGGSLVVTNGGPDALVGGNIFQLFSATTYTGSFSSITLPALDAGLVWNISRLSVDGTISIRSMPVAVNDSATTPEDTAATIAVLANDTDADGDTLAIQSVTQGAHGTVAIAGTSVTYTPEANWNGSDSFTYTITDNQDGTSTATVSVTVTPVNDAPVFTSNPITKPGATIGTAYSSSIAGDASDIDAGDILTFSKVSGPAWLNVAGNGALSGTPPSGNSGMNSFTVRVTDGGGLFADATLNISVAGLPSGWTGSDIGSVGIAGAASESSGTFTVSGSGADIGGTADAFQFASQTLVGDGEIRARVTSQTNTDALAKAGVMIRDGSGSGAVNALVAITPGNGFTFQSRSAVSGSTTSVAGPALNAAPNNWVRITRSGTLITAYASANGTSWTQIGTVNVTMASSVSVGLAVTSHNNTALGTATFDNVSVTAFPAPWLTADIGTTGLQGSAEYFGSAYTVKGAGIFGGSTDGFRYVYQTLSGDGSIIARVSTLQGTGTNARVGVMIRDTLANNARMAALCVNGSGGWRWERRATAGGSVTTTNSSSGTAPNLWVKLVRSGNTITAYRSADGTTWTTISSATITMASNCYIGLAVASGSTTTLNTSVMDNVNVVP